MTGQSRILWIIGIILALVVLGQLLAILKWVIGVVFLVVVVAVILRAISSNR